MSRRKGPGPAPGPAPAAEPQISVHTASRLTGCPAEELEQAMAAAGVREITANNLSDLADAAKRARGPKLPAGYAPLLSLHEVLHVPAAVLARAFAAGELGPGVRIGAGETDFAVSVKAATAALADVPCRTLFLLHDEGNRIQAAGVYTDAPSRHCGTAWRRFIEQARASGGALHLHRLLSAVRPRDGLMGELRPEQAAAFLAGGGAVVDEADRDSLAVWTSW